MSATLPAHDQIRIAIIGLGYVGLPLAVAFGRQVPTIGYDIDKTRIAELNAGRDHTLEVSSNQLRAAQQLRCSHDPADLQSCNVFIVKFFRNFFREQSFRIELWNKL